MPADPESSTPACTLTAADHAARIAWLTALNATALSGYDRDDNRLRLRYRMAAAAGAREWVRFEQRCCPFLRFTTEEDGGEFVVIIDVPAELGDAAEALLAPYAEGQQR